MVVENSQSETTIPDRTINKGKLSGGNSNQSVVIVGAGPMGVLLALKLGKAGVKVTILEKEQKTADAPRACGYFAASTLALHDAGVYDKTKEEGFLTRGLCWRRKPVDDGSGNRRLGDMVASMPLAPPDLKSEDMPPGVGLLCLQQSNLTRLFVREALATGNVSIDFNRELCDIEEKGTVVTAIAKDVDTGDMHRYSASFLVGADGGRSTTRRLLGIPFGGHTWPERVLATDVLVPNAEDPIMHTSFVFDNINFTVVTPLTEPVMGKWSLWRYATATDPQDDRSEEELLKDEHIASLYEKFMAGPRPLQYEIKARSLYRIHQRLANTFRRGRCVLAGDAAHVCAVSLDHFFSATPLFGLLFIQPQPYGALGLNSGILDVDALSDALLMIFNEGKRLSLLDVYSDERRKVFQFFVNPTTTHNKLRMSSDPDNVVEDDWLLRSLKNPSPEALEELAKPYFETWRTDMRKLADTN
ncbi:FAD/NAD(P)-binding domain-containing protein [Rhizodiscina lignyota]|uniref:FAD/NAD(P)-binding domain-containing protein n=1 Tax=Rhizodiscina lignyota TaxID=1504668 RepID=A0A9P4MC03_9PEZI|nr:FAD/NAD(P)-binding domain-containing protein [Rhizodiscina lignyota]